MFWSLFTAVIVYPLLHESGHILVAIIMGAKITGFNLYPTPYVACETMFKNNILQVFVGFGGTIIPFITVRILKFKFFWIWYVLFATRVINALSIFLSIVSLCFFAKGIIWENEDAVKMVNIIPNASLVIFVSFLVLFVCETIGLIKENPYKKCLKYFY